MKIVRIVGLGFKLSTTLSPSPHIAMTYNRAFQVLEFIMRLYKDFKLLMSLNSLYCASSYFRIRICNLGYLQCFWLWSTWTCPTKIFEICSFCFSHPHLTQNYTNITNANALEPAYSLNLTERRIILNLKFIRGLITNQIDSTFLLSQIHFEVPSHNPSANSN